MKISLLLIALLRLAGGTGSSHLLSNCHSSPAQQAADERFMRRAIELAALANGMTSPNPCVGCVLVDDKGIVVGEGYHVKAGQPHAEAVALKHAGDLSRGCTAYVSLEPCNHFGRTPPCSQALVKHGVSRIVVGMVDPDPRVSGSGISHLIKAGIPVTLGVSNECYKACRALNRPFVHRTCRGSSLLGVAVVGSDPSRSSSLESLLPQLLSAAPEADTLIITAPQLLSASADKLVAALPAHIALAILVPVPGIKGGGVNPGSAIEWPGMAASASVGAGPELWAALEALREAEAKLAAGSASSSSSSVSSNNGGTRRRISVFMKRTAEQPSSSALASEAAAGTAEPEAEQRDPDPRVFWLQAEQQALPQLLRCTAKLGSNACLLVLQSSGGGHDVAGDSSAVEAEVRAAALSSIAVAGISAQRIIYRDRNRDGDGDGDRTGGGAVWQSEDVEDS